MKESGDRELARRTMSSRSWRADGSTCAPLCWPSGRVLDKASSRCPTTWPQTGYSGCQFHGDPMHKKMDQHKVLSHLQSRLLAACQVEASKVGVEIQKFFDLTVNVSSRQHRKEANRAHKRLACFKRRLPRRVASTVSRAWSSKRVVGVDPRHRVMDQRDPCSAET